MARRPAYRFGDGLLGGRGAPRKELNELGRRSRSRRDRRLLARRRGARRSPAFRPEEQQLLALKTANDDATIKTGVGLRREAREERI